MAVVPVYESKVTLQPNNGGGEISPIDTTKLFPAVAPDGTKAGVALMAAQKKMDAARALEAKNAALQYVTNATYGDNGYTKLLGKNALEQDDEGNGLVQRNLVGFDKYMDGYFADNKLTLEQQKLARKEIFGVRLQFQSGMGSHVIQEGKRYEAEQVTTAKTNAINAGAVAQNSQQLGFAVQNLDSALEQEKAVYGWDDNIMKAKTAEARSRLYSGAINNAILRASTDPIGAYRDAKTLFDTHYKEMDAITVVALQGRIRALEEDAVKAQLLTAGGTFTAVGNLPGVKATSLAVTNGTKTPTAFAFSELTRNNRHSVDGRTVARYANGGMGASGLRLEDAVKTVKAHGHLSVPGESDAEIAHKFATDPGFNYEVGMARFEDMVHLYGDVNKALAAYQFGEKDVEDAVSRASADGKGDQWMDYMKVDTSNLRRVIKRVEEAQDGVVRGSDGKILNPCSADFIEKQMPLRTDEERRAFIEANAGDYVRKNPLSLERLTDTLRAQDVKQLNDEKLKYQQNFYNCIKAVENGSEMPAQAYNNLPIAAQRWIDKYQNKRAMGDGTPDYEMYSKYREDPSLLARLTEDEYQTFVRPLMGDKVTEIDILRYRTQSASGMAIDQKFINNVKADQGNLAYEFAPSPDAITGAMGRVLGMKYDITDKKSRGMYLRIETAAIQEAQRRSQYTGTGKPVALSGAELDNYIRDFYRDRIVAEGVTPFYMTLGQLPDRTAADIKSGVEWLANRYAYAKFGRNIQGTRDMQEMVFGSICNGESFGYGMPSVEELKAENTRISQNVLKEAETQLKGEGKPVTSVSLLNRYMLLLNGWTSYGDTRSYISPEGPSKATATDTEGSGESGGD